MDLRLLSLFSSPAMEHKTMHSLAAAVSVSQPALSKAIRISSVSFSLSPLAATSWGSCQRALATRYFVTPKYGCRIAARSV